MYSPSKEPRSASSKSGEIANAGAASRYIWDISSISSSFVCGRIEPGVSMNSELRKSPELTNDFNAQTVASTMSSC